MIFGFIYKIIFNKQFYTGEYVNLIVHLHYYIILYYIIMEYNTNNKIYGVPEGISYGQNERVDELNDRIYSRSFSDIPLAPNFEPRPVPTKYSLFPIVNRRTESSIKIQPAITHQVELNFSPATYNGPSAGYFNNIDVETGLRNQTVALQHGANQGVYVPSTHSDLYHVSVPSKPGVPQPHPDLFSHPKFATTHFHHDKIGSDRFHNYTRTQLRTIQPK